MKLVRMFILIGAALVIGLSGYFILNYIAPINPESVHAADSTPSDTSTSTSQQPTSSPSAGQKPNANPTNGNPSTANQPVGIIEGSFAPNFTLENLSGAKVSLADFRGKYVLLNFWAIWCPPCRAEMPDLDKFYQANKADFVVLGVELGDKKADVQKFMANGKYTYPILLDTKQQVSNTYKVTAIPTTLVLDRAGKIVYSTKGALNQQALENIKKTVLAAEKKSSK